MRPLLRTFALGLGLILPALALVVTACSGASEQGVFDPNDTTSSSSGTSGTSGTSSGTSGSSGSATSGSSGAVADASVDTPCPPENEPNDSRDSANSIAGTLCGVISPEGESDFLTFQLQPPSTSLSIAFSGQVTLKVSVGGQSVTLNGTTSPKIPFEKNQRYIIEVRGAQKLPNNPWRVDVMTK